MDCLPSDFLCIANNCSGANFSGTELFNYWRTHNCPAAYSQIINTGPTGILQYNPESQLFVQGQVIELFNTYFETNELTDNVTSPEFNTFQNTLLNLCIDPTLPGVCGNFLEGYCNGGTGGFTGFTRTQVENSPVLINFCGCYTPPNPTYLDFTLGMPECQIGATGCTGCSPKGPNCIGQSSCDPLCHRALTSQRAFQPTGSFITCPEGVCVIDDVTVNTVGSVIPGGVNFNTVCSGCGDGCICIVSGTNVSGTLSSVGVGSNFNQLCGADSVCITEDASGNVLSTSACTDINPANVPIGPFSEFPNWGIVFIVVLIVFIILFISIAMRYDYTR